MIELSCRKVHASAMRKTITALLVVLICGLGAAYPQARLSSEEQGKLIKKFFEERGKCKDLLKNRRWKAAETICKAATKIADRLPADRELEKMGSYELVGHAVMRQGRFQEALEYYSRALDFAKPKLTDTDAELGRLYGDMAIAHHGLRNWDKARELYRQAERTYQLAYANMASEDSDDEIAKVRQEYVKSLKKLLEYHLLAAEQAGATAEVEEVKKMLNALPPK